MEQEQESRRSIITQLYAEAGTPDAVNTRYAAGVEIAAALVHEALEMEIARAQKAIAALKSKEEAALLNGNVLAYGYLQGVLETLRGFVDIMAYHLQASDDAW